MGGPRVRPRGAPARGTESRAVGPQGEGRAAGGGVGSVGGELPAGAGPRSRRPLGRRKPATPSPARPAPGPPTSRCPPPRADPPRCPPTPGWRSTAPGRGASGGDPDRALAEVETARRQAPDFVRCDQPRGGHPGGFSASWPRPVPCTAPPWSAIPIRWGCWRSSPSWRRGRRRRCCGQGLRPWGIPAPCGASPRARRNSAGVVRRRGRPWPPTSRGPPAIPSYEAALQLDARHRGADPGGSGRGHRRRGGAGGGAPVLDPPASHRGGARLAADSTTPGRGTTWRGWSRRIRHEVIKHHTTVLASVADALEDGEGEVAEWAADRLYGPGGALERLSVYVEELQRLGRRAGVTPETCGTGNPTFAPLLASIPTPGAARSRAEARNLAAPAGRPARSCPRRINRATATMPWGGWWPGLSVLRLEPSLIEGAWAQVLGEPAFLDQPVPDLQISPVPSPEAVYVRIFSPPICGTSWSTCCATVPRRRSTPRVAAWGWGGGDRGGRDHRPAAGGDPGPGRQPGAAHHLDDPRPLTSRVASAWRWI